MTTLYLNKASAPFVWSPSLNSQLPIHITSYFRTRKQRITEQAEKKMNAGQRIYRRDGVSILVFHKG
jgi:hypothetical protein